MGGKKAQNQLCWLIQRLQCNNKIKNPTKEGKIPAAARGCENGRWRTKHGNVWGEEGQNETTNILYELHKTHKRREFQWRKGTEERGGNLENVSNKKAQINSDG